MDLLCSLVDREIPSDATAIRAWESERVVFLYLWVEWYSVSLLSLRVMLAGMGICLLMLGNCAPVKNRCIGESHDWGKKHVSAFTLPVLVMPLANGWNWTYINWGGGLIYYLLFYSQMICLLSFSLSVPAGGCSHRLCCSLLHAAVQYTERKRLGRASIRQRRYITQTLSDGGEKCGKI